MILSKQERTELLRKLADSEGFASVDALIEATVVDSASPGICAKANCGGTIEVEPDQDRGWCPVCGSNTVMSALILAGII